MKLIRIFLCAALAVCGFMPAAAQRTIVTLNDGWVFAPGDPGGAQDSVLRDGPARWEPVSLPHTWNATDAYRAKTYRRGPGWYRRLLRIPADYAGRRLFLRFGAVNQQAEVYVNGRLVAGHRGGYTAFTVDITPFCHPGQYDVIAVRADNSNAPVPPLSGDFTFFGGIYRGVELITTAAQYFQPDGYGSDGLFIRGENVSAGTAQVRLRGTVRNDSDRKVRLVVQCRVSEPGGKTVLTEEYPVTVAPRASAGFDHLGPRIPNPRLWSPGDPALYTVECTLRDAATGRVADRLVAHTGFRWFRFEPAGGFFLNGKPCKLIGVNRHQDQYPFGNALTGEFHRRDVRLMKEAGCNFLRIAHYPQDRTVLEECDRLGILVWEEIPIVSQISEEPAFGDVCERNLREMVRQHYNHPSVILWGYMNEVLISLNGKEDAYRERMECGTVALARRLEKALKEEDPARLSVMAFHHSDAYNRSGLSAVTDVVGWNIYQGWYGGELPGFERVMEQEHRKEPSHPMIVSEYGAGSDERLHTTEPEIGDFSIEYQQKYLEHYQPVIENRPYICGAAYWNMVDFCSAVRDESMPRINNKGLLYNDRRPKDVYYYLKASRRKDVPVLHIASRDWSGRTGVQEGDAPVVQPVKVYSNLPSAELFMDGVSLGVKRFANYTAVWNVPFTAGRHAFRAVGFAAVPAEAAVAGNAVAEDALSICFRAVPAFVTAENAEGLELAVNAGSNCFYTSPGSGLTWVPDRPYVPGGWGYVGGGRQKTTTEIAGTPDNPLYQTLRESPEAYRFDVPDGEYEVELLFADIYAGGTVLPYYLGAGTRAAGAGANRFDILLNGRCVAPAVDAAYESGRFRAVRKGFTVCVSGGEGIEVRFRPLAGKTFLNGIRLVKR